MKKIDVEQGSDEWIEIRKTKVCASDMPAILNKSPYKTRERVLAEKRDEIKPKAKTASMSRGNEREKFIRSWCSERFEQTFTPCVIIHPSKECFLASLDGANLTEDLILEIKACNREVFRSCLLGDVVDHYMIQVQTQLFCAEVERAIFCVEWMNEMNRHHVTAFRDEKMIKEIEEEGLKFYEEMIK